MSNSAIFTLAALVVAAGAVLFALQLIAFRILRLILRFVVIFGAFVAGCVLLQPDTFQVSRSAVIQAAPSQIYQQINDFHKWEAWSPWAKLDPQAKTAYEGAGAGPGAVFRWSGDHNVGEGSNTIVESVADQRVRIRLDMVRPVKAANDVEFVLAPEGSGTRVTWSMSGKNDFLSKAVGLFMDCDKMVGTQFEQGLANLATAVGAPAVSP